MNSRLQTKDIYFAAVLSSLGAKLESVDKTDPKQMIFEFSPKQYVFATGELANLSTENVEGGTLTLAEAEIRWANRSLLVNASDFAEAIKRFKSIVHTK